MGPIAAIRYLHRVWKARRRDERDEIAALRHWVRPGDVVLDLGAHKGSYLFWLQRSVGPTGRVLAFEPQPFLAGYLREVVKTFGWRHVEVRNEGVSERAGTLTLVFPEGSGAVSPGASFERAAGTGGREVPIPVTSLDREFPEGSKAPSFIKCDVEGHELAVFRGGAAMLRRARPVLLFECEQRHLATHRVADVFRELEGYGYRGEFFGPDGLRPIAEFRPEVHQASDGDRFWDRPGYCNNFLFVPADAPRG